MKKLISLLLVICILCPLIVGCMWQYDEIRIKKAYLRQFGIEGKTPEDVIIDYDGGTYNGARVVMLDVEWHDPEEWTETVGDTTITYYDSNRILVYKFGKLYTLKEAKNRLILSKKQIVAIVDKYNATVQSYLDVCDKYDFKNSDECDIEIGEHLDDCTYKLIIGFDVRFYNSLKDDANLGKSIEEYIASYLGQNLCKFYRNIGYTKDNKMMVCRFKYSNRQNIDNIPDIIKKISCVPGIDLVWCDCIYHDFGESINYALPNAETWGIGYSKIEKVWDFTTGSFLSLKNKF